MNKPSVLVLSNRHDYSTDFICVELEGRGIPFLRLNRDMFSSYTIILDVFAEEMRVVLENEEYLVTNDSLRSVYYRAPVFLRNSKSYTLDEQLERSQWSAFLRNLIVFDAANWINHPVNTYRAENKLLQLKLARDSGLDTPQSWCANSAPGDTIEKSYVVKALDTALFYDGGTEKFTYSSIVTEAELHNSQFHNAPVIIQDYIQDKTDLRVTVINDEIFPVAIESKAGAIKGDWRTVKKELLTYSPIELPQNVQNGILRLMKTLGLSFGGIDLALSNGIYYFIEVNPTGEWGWLNRGTGFSIDSAIVDALEA